MRLENATDIMLGVVLKRKEATYNGIKAFHYNVFNIRCYDENINYDDFYSMEDLSTYVTKKGDLIFRLSLPSKIILVDEKTEGLLINNLYCIIRTKEEMIKAEYLKWFLESSNSRKQIEKFVIGTKVKSIPVAKLRMLEIPIIKLKEQEKIAKVIYNWEAQKKLYDKIVKEKEIYYNLVIDKLINGGNK